MFSWRNSRNVRRNFGSVLLALLLLTGLHHQWAIHRAVQRMADDAMGATIGTADARNIIVEFMDYRCSGCRAFAPALQAFAQAHPDVRIVIRHYPFYGAPSVHEAQLALASAQQGKFPAMHAALVGHDAPIAVEEISALAQQQGLDLDRLQKDVKDPAIMRHIRDTMDSADLLGIHSEPAFIINGTVYIPAAGPVPDLAHFTSIYQRFARKNP